ncbi:hypothetical protein Bca4012_092111 [Brassica carinata]
MILAKVIEYCKKHVVIPDGDGYSLSSMEEELRNWDAEFMKNMYVVEEMSSNLNKTCEYEEKSGTFDGGSNDTEKSGTLDGSGEDETQSGIPYVNGEDEIQSSTFEEISEDEISRGSRDGSFGFDSDMSFNGETENQMVGGLEGTQNILQILERISVGQIFSTKAELQNKLRMITIFQNFDYTTYKSTKTLLVLKCFVAGCSWKIRASVMQASSEFKVQKYIDIHTYPATNRCSRHRQATSKCIGELYLGKFGKVGLGISECGSI